MDRVRGRIEDNGRVARYASSGLCALPCGELGMNLRRCAGCLGDDKAKESGCNECVGRHLDQVASTEYMCDA